MRNLLALLLAMVALMAAARRHHTGPGHLDVPAAEAAAPDTLRTHLDSLKFSGYDKPNGAVREAFFVTNLHPDSVEVTEVCVTFTYSDLQGRMLHEATHNIKCHIPPGATRRLEVPSWDRTNAFHYYLSPAPPRRPSTPYRVKSHLQYILVGTRHGASAGRCN